jgi:hypothetical protein
MKLKRGDLIKLNETAKKWTHGQVFVVDEVLSFGVVCYAEVEGGEAFYRAPWSEIGEKTGTVEKSQ